MNEGKTLTLKTYGHKLMRRRNSLLYPYLIYNALALLIFAIAQALMPSLVTSGKLAIVNYGWRDFLMAFWNSQGTGIPIDGPLWFIRALIVICLLTPLVYLGIKHLRWGFVLLLCIDWFCEILDYGIPGAQCSFFFTVGALCAIKGIDFGKYCCKWRRILWIVYPLVMLVDFFYAKENGYNTSLHKLMIILGVMTFVSVGYYIQSQKDLKFPARWTAATFFVYAFHEPYMDQVNKVLGKVLPLSKDPILFQVEGIALYFGVTIVYIAVLIILFDFIKQYSPSVAKVLSGGR